MSVWGCGVQRCAKRRRLFTVLRRTHCAQEIMLRRSPSVITISEKDVAELKALVEARAAAKKMEETGKSTGTAPASDAAPSAAAPPNAVKEQN